MRRDRGFTIVEMVLGSAIFLVLFGAAVVALIGDQRAERVLTAQIGPEMRARDALVRLSAELRMGGVRGEDRNDNGELDEGEDVNANGRLDADWSLEDGAADRPELTFNRRIDFESPGPLRVSKSSSVPWTSISAFVSRISANVASPAKATPSWETRAARPENQMVGVRLGFEHQSACSFACHN